MAKVHYKFNTKSLNYEVMEEGFSNENMLGLEKQFSEEFIQNNLINELLDEGVLFKENEELYINNSIKEIVNRFFYFLKSEGEMR